MSPSKGHGLRPEDVDLIFPDSPAGSPGPTRPEPITPIDFKKRQSGEREDPPDPEAEERSWPRADLESAEPAPDLSSEPWPSPIEDAPEDSPIEATAEPDPEGEIDLDPGRERRAAIQELGKATGRAMIDEAAAPKPKPLERVRGERSPSDKTWGPEIKKIFAGNR